MSWSSKKTWQITPVFRLLILFTTVFFYQNAIAVEPQPNLDLYKKQLLSYYDTGAYAKDIALVTQQALNYLKQRLYENAHSTTPKKLAIVFDIDETVLSNFKYIREVDFAFILKYVPQKQPLAEDTLIPAVSTLYRAAIKHHVAVFFITGRPEKLREATILNLRRVGFHSWTALFLKPNNYPKEKSAANYKIPVRKKIVNAGYDVIMNIGDQYSDLVGGYADKVFKLPNPFYYIP